MKKALAFIMAIMVLAFSVMPCADAPNEGNNEVAAFSLSKATSQEEAHDDTCSPFCICTCCAGFSTTASSSPLSTLTIPYKLVHSSFVEVRTISIALPIWQPPRLV